MQMIMELNTPRGTKSPILLSRMILSPLQNRTIETKSSQLWLIAVSCKKKKHLSKFGSDWYGGKVRSEKP